MHQGTTASNVAEKIEANKALDQRATSAMPELPQKTQLGFIELPGFDENNTLGIE